MDATRRKTGSHSALVLAFANACMCVRACARACLCVRARVSVCACVRVRARVCVCVCSEDVGNGGDIDRDIYPAPYVADDASAALRRWSPDRHAVDMENVEIFK